MKNLLKILFYGLACIVFVTCKKEHQTSEAKIIITKPLSDTTINLNDTLQINGKILLGDESPNEIGLFVNNKLIESKNTKDFTFTWSPPGGNVYYQIYVKAKVGSEYVCSDTILIICNEPIPSVVDISYYRIGEYFSSRDTYIGDSLMLTIKPVRFEPSDIKQLTLYFNDKKLGTKTKAPFTFNTPPVLMNNIIRTEYIDKNDINYSHRDSISFSRNPPPSITYTPIYRYEIAEGYFFTSEIAVMSLQGYDNEMINTARIYVDNQYYGSEIIKSTFANDIRINLGQLKAGTHTTYCVCYDNRGDSTISDLSKLTILPDANTNDMVIDLVNTQNSDIVYALTGKSVLRVNPTRRKYSGR